MPVIVRVVFSVAGTALIVLMSAVPAFAALGGEHDNDARQEGGAHSGDANGGQIVGVASGGDTSLDAANHTRDSRIRTGDADGSNDLERLTWTFGPHVNEPGFELHDLDDEDEEDDWDFFSFAETGDGVAGQIIGITTSAGGSTDAVLANTSDDMDVWTGDASALDGSFAETGTAIGGQSAGVASSGVTNLDASNLSHASDVGSGDAFASDDSTALTGDGIAGQLTGVTTGRSGRADIVVANTSEEVEALTGDADAFDDAFAETGDAIAGQLGGVTAGGLTSVDATNSSTDGEVRSGDAEAIEATALTGDGIAGQVFGVVSSLGGRADLVSANTSNDFDLLTGDAFSENDDFDLVGWFPPF